MRETCASFSSSVALGVSRRAWAGSSPYPAAAGIRPEGWFPPPVMGGFGGERGNLAVRRLYAVDWVCRASSIGTTENGPSGPCPNGAELWIIHR